MSLRTFSLVAMVAFALACGSSTPAPRSDEPTTARDKQRREAEAAGEEPRSDAAASKWKGWRYTGERQDCFFVVGRRCFKTEAAACTAARCGDKRCQVSGGGPAQVSCAGG